MASTTISLNEKAYSTLKKAKKPGQSFSDVVIEYVHFPADTCGEMLERMEQRPPPSGFDLERLDKISTGRKRRSKR